MCPHLLQNENAQATGSKSSGQAGFSPISMVVLFLIPSLLPNVFHLLVYVTMPGAQKYRVREEGDLLQGMGDGCG